MPAEGQVSDIWEENETNQRQTLQGDGSFPCKGIPKSGLLFEQIKCPLWGRMHLLLRLFKTIPHDLGHISSTHKQRKEKQL